MDKLLSTLFENELLAPETREQLQEALALHVKELTESVRQETETRVRVELAEQWLETREQLVEAIDVQVSELVASEIDTLKESIDTFRDLEVEMAGKLLEAKADMQVAYEGDLANLLEFMDEFLEERLQSEFEELRESIEETRRQEFGRRVFESFVTEFRTMFVDDTEVDRELAAAQKQLKESQQTIAAAKRELAEVRHTTAMEAVLAPLSGTQREMMETVLTGTPTSKLQEKYDQYVGRIVRESADAKSAKTSEKRESTKSSSVKTGDLTESAVNTTTTTIESGYADELRRLSGIKRP